MKPRMSTLLSLVIATAACDDATTGGSDATTTADAADTVTASGLGIDYGDDLGAATIRYEATGAGFTATPWPTDRKRLTSGAPDLADFPNPSGLALIDDYKAYGGEALDGWSRNGGVYFQLSAPIDPTTLPDADTTRTDPQAVAQLVAVTAASPRYGQRTPVLFKQSLDGQDPFYLGPTLVMRPVYGFPLADAETYCAFVTRAVKDAGGRYLGVAPGFADALANEASLAPLRGWLASQTAIAAADLAAATCFSTQDATRDLRLVEEVIAARASTAPYDLQFNGSTQHFHEITGKYRTPNFQGGPKPYLTEGGDLVRGEDGMPIVQLDEEIRFRLLIPRQFDMPAAGWPVVLYSHGTFGDWATCRDGEESQVLREGLAMLCIDQPLHGVRAADGEGKEVNFLEVFNFLNPRSGRMSFRQSAIDTMWQSKMIADGRFDLPADATAFDEPIRLDPTTIAFFGHSHGGLAGAIVLAIDPRLKGAVLSGASGVLVETILRRTDPLDIRATLATLLGLAADQLDTFHPVLTMAQTLVDATDPINYAPYWLEPVTGGRSKHVFMTEGVADALSPAVGADAVAAAAGIPLLVPVDHESPAHALRGLAPVTMPVNSNLISTTGQLVTGGIRQFAGGDHWVALTLPEAIHIWRGFFRAFREGDVPTIAP